MNTDVKTFFALRRLIAVCLSFLVSVGASAVVITDFSNFSESGNMLDSSGNDREQEFSPSLNAIAVVDPTLDGLPTVGSASQEIYGSSEFTSFTTIGYRLQIDIVDFIGNGGSNERAGLMVSSTIPAGGPASGDVRTGGDYFYWVLRNGNSVQAGMFSAIHGEEEAGAGATGLVVGTSITGLYMERVNDISNGPSWDLGYIDGNGNDVFVQNRATVNGSPITADGTNVGLYSDMRAASSVFIFENLSYGMVPEPSSLTLVGMLAIGFIPAIRKR